jgi:hypothetical protein
MPDARLDQLASRAEITEVVIRYVRAVDRMDEAMLRSCFHPDSRHRHGGFDGPSSDFCSAALEICGRVRATHHQLGPVSIELAGEVAFVETYYTSHHRFGEVPPSGREAARGSYRRRALHRPVERRDGSGRSPSARRQRVAALRAVQRPRLLGRSRGAAGSAG